MEPFASVSNLANLSVDIPLGLQDQGNDVRCLMPKYGFISERKYILREVIRLKEILFNYDDNDYDYYFLNFLIFIKCSLGCFDMFDAPLQNC